MKIAVVCRSADKGGAAVVSRRLTEAFRDLGVEATMIMADDSRGEWVVPAGHPLLSKLTFAAERLQIFFDNGFSRKNLWKADSGAFGLPLWRHPVVKEADAVILNWFNQGMLSLDGVGRICDMGKRVIWTMHDMWPMTGVCHHAMECARFEKECGKCPLLRSKKSSDLSHKVRAKKENLYNSHDISFVAVSNWLAEEARRSSLLRNRDVHVITNPFRRVAPDSDFRPFPEGPAPKRILFAAADIDNWIKGLDTFRKAVNILARRPGKSEKPEVVLMGGMKDPSALEGFELPVRYLGKVSGDGRIAAVFSGCDVVANCSLFENLPGTLIEGQAYGAIPVSFDRGGQADIISHRSTGFLAPFPASGSSDGAEAIAEGIEWALGAPDSVRREMLTSVETRFDARTVASSYLQKIINKC